MFIHPLCTGILGRPSRRAVLALAAMGLVVRDSLPEATPQIVLFLGPDPLADDSTFDQLREALERRRRTLGRTVQLVHVFAGSDAQVELRTAQALRGFDGVAVAPTGMQLRAAHNVGYGGRLVFATYLDPARLGFVDSLHHPGRRRTGISLDDQLHAKRLELLRDAYPQTRRVAALVDESWLRFFDPQRVLQDPGRALGLHVQVHRADTPDQVDTLMRAESQAADAWYLPPTTIADDAASEIRHHLQRMRMPSMHTHTRDVEAGATLAYEQDSSDVYDVLAELTERVLRVADAGAIPVQRPRRFRLVVRGHHAEGWPRVSPSVIRRADRVLW